MGLGVKLEDVTAHYGSWAAISELSLTVRPGEFFSLLGPSGCGKTTILRLISGFMSPSSGSVVIGERDMSSFGPDRRPTALIFQNLALFPLMTVWENIAFGLKYRGVPFAERRRRAEQLMSRVSLEGFADKAISTLSGGQRQRVAIARALAVEPEVLLLDEPLSALDLKLRQHMRAELRSLQRQIGVTFIYITHDQGEALNMADRVAVMSQGRIEQVDDAKKIYEEPSTAFVARFVGEANEFEGRVSRVTTTGAVIDTQLGSFSGINKSGLQAGEKALAFIRPERCKIEGMPRASPLNRIPCTILRTDYEGASLRVLLEREGRHLHCSLPNDGAVPDLTPGAAVTFAFAPEATMILPRAAGSTDAGLPPA